MSAQSVSAASERWGAPSAVNHERPADQFITPSRELFTVQQSVLVLYRPGCIEVKCLSVALGTSAEFVGNPWCRHIAASHIVGMAGPRSTAYVLL
jgi:hypothetical protein